MVFCGVSIGLVWFTVVRIGLSIGLRMVCFVRFDLNSFGCWVNQDSAHWFVCFFVWWVKCSQFGCLVSRVLIM